MFIHFIKMLNHLCFTILNEYSWTIIILAIKSRVWSWSYSVGLTTTELPSGDNVSVPWARLAVALANLFKYGVHLVRCRFSCDVAPPLMVHIAFTTELALGLCYLEPKLFFWCNTDQLKILPSISPLYSICLDLGRGQLNTSLRSLSSSLSLLSLWHLDLNIIPLLSYTISWRKANR